jgi:hypothetical protein
MPYRDEYGNLESCRDHRILRYTRPPLNSREVSNSAADHTTLIFPENIPEVN